MTLLGQNKDLPLFIDLTFQVPMQYSFLQCQTLLSPPDRPTNECHFCFGPATSFFLELLVTALCSSPVAYGTPSNLGAQLPVSYLFAFSYCSWGSCSKNTGLVCHSLLQWTTFCQNSSLWLHHFGEPCMAWLIASLSYSSPFTTTSLWSVKGIVDLYNAKSCKMLAYIYFIYIDIFNLLYHLKFFTSNAKQHINLRHIFRPFVVKWAFALWIKKNINFQM